MKILGLQKLTLLDYPGKIACTVFTAGCNFRCPFCHNADLALNTPGAAEIGEEEIFSFLEKRAGVLEGVCITGGEPLLQEDIFDFIAKIKTLGYAVKLDTNGSFPEKLKNAVDNKLVDYIAMDIKNSPEKYAETVGLDICNVNNIIESVNILMKGGVPYEFRTTVVAEYHDTENFVAIGKWLSGADKYFLQSFIDSGNLISDGLHGRSKNEMYQYLSLLSRYIDKPELRGV